MTKTVRPGGARLIDFHLTTSPAPLDPDSSARDPAWNSGQTPPLRPPSASEELPWLGPAVRLDRLYASALTHHKAVRDARRSPNTFSYAQICMMNAIANSVAAVANALCTNDPTHRQLRTMFACPLLRAEISKLRLTVAELADSQVARIVGIGRAEVVGELAPFLPLAVITKLVELSDAGKVRMLDWTAGIVGAIRPDDNVRTMSGLQMTRDAVTYTAPVPREDLYPHGWGAALFAAANQDKTSPAAACVMSTDCIDPSLDLAILGSTNALTLFAHHAEQWYKLRAEPSLLLNSIKEILRLAILVRAFFCRLIWNTTFANVDLHAVQRVLLINASANRDETRFANPNRFDITRQPLDHLRFGLGVHFRACANVAKLQITTLLKALLMRIARMHVVAEWPIVSNTLQGPSYLLMEFTLAA